MTAPLAAVWDWQRHAACRRVDPDQRVFFAPDGEARGQARSRRVAAAKAVCNRCPVARSCRAHALAVGEPYGIWGGLTEAERRQRRRQ